MNITTNYGRKVVSSNSMLKNQEISIQRPNSIISETKSLLSPCDAKYLVKHNNLNFGGLFKTLNNGAIAGKIFSPKEYMGLKVIECINRIPKGIYVSAPNCVTQARFHKAYNAKEMEIAKEKIKALYIDTDAFPRGSIAISSRMNEAISTGCLLQCAGVGIVDKSKNIQTLFHCNPFIDSRKNRAILDYILSNSNPENLDIYIVPGLYNQTDNTIDFLVKNIKDINKNFEINFLNFKDSENSTIVLQNGQLRSCLRNNIVQTVNPKDKIIYCD